MAIILHKNIVEDKLHAPKGFNLPATNSMSYALRSENDIAIYQDVEYLPAAINFVDGNSPPPTLVLNHIYVIIDGGGGVVDPGWGAIGFDSWNRYDGSNWVSVIASDGFQCYDKTAKEYKTFNGTNWVSPGGGGGLADGDYGDITVTASGVTWTIDDEVVTFAKMQHIATAKLLGRATAGTGDVEELSLSSDLQILLGVLSLVTNPLYISDITTVNLIDDVLNWTSENYTGTLITGTFQGQHHVNSTYWFTCTHDNVWIRILRS